MRQFARKSAGLLVVAETAGPSSIARAITWEQPTVVQGLEAAAAALRTSGLRRGIADASAFLGAELPRELASIPWVVLTSSIDDELALLREHPTLDARHLRKAPDDRHLEALQHLVADRTRETEPLLATLGAQFSGMVAYWGADERCRYANEAYQTWFAWSPEKLIGTTMRELLGPKLYALNEPYIRGVLAGEPQQFERTIADPAGGPPRHSLATYTPDIERGVVRGFVAVVTDISAQHRLQEELVARERRWAALFELLPVGVSVMDEAGKLLEVNPALQKILALGPEDFAAERHKKRRYVRRDGTSVAPEELPTARALAIPGVPAGPMEIGIAREDGETVWAEVSARAFPDERQTVVVVRDRTAERTSEARFRAIVDASPVPYALNDDLGNVTYVNAAFVSTFGWTLEDMPTLEAWWPRAYPDPVYRAAVADEWVERLARARRDGAGFEPMELRIRAKDGRDRIAIVGATSLQGSFEGVHLVVLHDVTEQRAAEAMRLQLERQRLDAQKTESVGALAAGIAHDFNNILAPILARAELAFRGLPAASPLREHVSEIIVGTNRAAELVRQILLVSRPTTDVMARVDLGVLVREVAQLIRASVPANISLETSVAPGVPPVTANHGRLHQVVLNLVANARDAMERRGGTLSVSVDVAPDDHVALEVRDTGDGMTAEVAARVFEPYFTTKVGGKGTGLGLSTVHAIVSRLGGTVSIDSEPERGTTFRVLLPAATPDVVTSGVPPRRTGDVSLHDAHVLVVDDEPAVANAIDLVLVSLGSRTTIVHNAKDALAAVDRHADLAAVITDLSMPGMNGIALAEEIRKRRPGLPVLLMTGFGDGIAHALERGVARVLEKPCSVSVLGEALEQVLRGRPIGRFRDGTNAGR